MSLHGCSSKAQPLLLTLDKVAPPDLEGGVAPLSHPAPALLPLLGHGVAPLREESLRRNGVAIMVNKRVQNAVLGCSLKNDRKTFVCFQGKSFNITVIQAYVPTSNTEEAEVEWIHEDLQDRLELTSTKDVLFIIGDWNANVRGQETPGVTGKFGLGMQNEAGQRLIEFWQENSLVIANTLFQQHKRRLYTWTSPDGQH